MHTEITRQAVQDGPGIFSADETAVLTEFFSHGGSDKRGQSRVAALPDLIDDHPELAAKVGTLAVEVIQERLPGWGCVLARGTLVLGRKVKRPPARRVVVVPRHLLTINWADSGPGFSWLEGYHATFIPGFERFIVTASRDCDDLYDCCDHAIGWFDAHTDWKKAARTIVKAWWSKRRDCQIGPWADLLDPGSLGKAEAHALCDAIWPREEERDSKIVNLQTGSWERGERMFNEAKNRFDVYLERRRKKGEKVKVLKPPYRVGQVRAILEVDGIRVRVFFREEVGLWRKA